MISNENSIVNLSCSILKEFKAPFSHPTIGKVDALINGAYRNVILMVFSGIGLKEMQRSLAGDGFFAKNFVMPLSSVFPSGPIPGEISLLTGLNPSEHGYFGRKLFIKELDKDIDLVKEFDLAEKYLPYKTILERINAGYVGKAKEIKAENLDEMIEKVLRESEIYRKEYIYSYWQYPREIGSKSEAEEYIRLIEGKIEDMTKKLSDSILLITSDHGFIDVEYKSILDNEELTEMLEREPSIEDRVLAFSVKDRYIKDFPKTFKKYFGGDFEIYSREEAIERELFGSGLPNNNLNYIIGDYIAVAINNISLKNIDEEPIKYRGHSGLTREEVDLPLICISKRRVWF